MRNLLIDNWNLLNIFYDLVNLNKVEFNESYKDFLMSVVLWDKIYYPSNEMSTVWNDPDSILSKIVFPYDDSKHLFNDEAESIYNGMPTKDKYSSVVAQGAIRYQLLSNSLGLNYLAAPDRAAFLKENDYLGSIMRSDIFNIVDSSVMNKFRELNNAMGDKKISFEMPLLVDYIIYNSDDSSSHLSCALEIKNDKSVKQYREYISGIEEQISSGNWTGILSFENDVKELVNDIVNIDRKHIFNAGLTVLPIPSFGISKDISIKTPLLHLTFIKDIVKFAFKNRKQR